MADIATGAVQGSVGDAVNALLNLFGDACSIRAAIPNTDAQAAIAQLSTAGCDDFNAKYPDDPTVAYFSIAGRSENGDGDRIAARRRRRRSSSKWDQDHGPINALLVADGVAHRRHGQPVADERRPRDRGSARWGTFLGCVPADHLDEVCQIGGQSSGSGYDCVTMYRDVADWLVARGF